MCRRFWLFSGGVLACAFLVSAQWVKPWEAITSPLAGGVQFDEPGWDLGVAAECAEDVSALATTFDAPRDRPLVFVGTAPRGGVYRFDPNLPRQVSTIAVGLGDEFQHGTCAVCELAVRDLDSDGEVELLAATSQINPRGQPRLYVWTIGTRVIPRGVARPAIQSSWSHGLGFAPAGEGGAQRVFSDFCGHGEVVEYRLFGGSAESGFHSEGVSWRLVGKLPASGEGTQVADLDGDGRPEVCFATGYSLDKAAIQVHDATNSGIKETPKWVLREDGRFGNVKFIAGDVGSDGTYDLIAWWCRDLAGGEILIVRYRLDPAGAVHRTEIARGDGGQMWPIDGQMAVGDLNDDGAQEVWFASASGNLWRYDPEQSVPVARVCKIDGGIAPIAAAAADHFVAPRLYIGSGRRVLHLSNRSVQKNIDLDRFGPAQTAGGPARSSPLGRPRGTRTTNPRRYLSL